MSDDQEDWQPPEILVAVDIVIFTLRNKQFHLLLIKRGIEPFKDHYALPGGFLNHDEEDLYAAALRELKEETNLDGNRLHIEQLGAYGTPDRDPRGRVLSVAYMAIAPSLPEPSAGTDASGATWTPVEDVLSDQARLAFDHRQIVDDAIEQARTKLERFPLATTFCGDTFTITQLQHVYEAVWGVELDPRNFYRKVQNVPGFIEPSGAERRASKGRPSRLFTAGPAKILQPPLVRPHRTTTPEERR